MTMTKTFKTNDTTLKYEDISLNLKKIDAIRLKNKGDYDDLKKVPSSLMIKCLLTRYKFELSILLGLIEACYIVTRIILHI